MAFVPIRSAWFLRLHAHHCTYIYYRGRYHVAQYGVREGEPECVGSAILDFISDSRHLTAIRAALDANLVYEYEESEMDRSTASLNLLTGHGILSILADTTELVPVKVHLEEIGSVGLKWAYVIDFDQRVFEIWTPHNDRRLQITPSQRFNFLPVINEANDEYRRTYGPNMVGRFHFLGLPTIREFVLALRGEEDWEDDEEDDEEEGHGDEGKLIDHLQNRDGEDVEEQHSESEDEDEVYHFTVRCKL